ncbi:MAG: hypothetical protein IIY21_07520 [Clostridiales bacterium]|nr:hypothetical protein [Clostridiales bacterium]MBQ1572526.1 hypothetical protein [Clostridiales bacterium]
MLKIDNNNKITLTKGDTLTLQLALTNPDQDNRQGDVMHVYGDLSATLTIIEA